VFSPSVSSTIADEPKKPMSTVPASSARADSSIESGFPAIAVSDAKRPEPRDVPPPTERRSIAAFTSALTLLGLSTLTPLSLNATTPIRIELGCCSAKATAAFFAASIRVGWRSFARMLFETSKARITVPSRCGRVTLMAGRASEKETSASAAAKSANGTWVGDRRVETALLDHMDRFRLGNVVVELVRGDEGSPEDLDAARTTAVPVQSILDSIQLRLTTTIEREGETVVVAGNKPFFLSDPASSWLVEEGRIDVFTVAVKDGEPSGARTHFVSIEQGHLLFGMDLESYGMGSGFLATGRTGTRLRKIPVVRLRALAGDPTQGARISGLVDDWINAVSDALVRGLPAASPATWAGGDSLASTSPRRRSRANSSSSTISTAIGSSMRPALPR